MAHGPIKKRPEQKTRMSVIVICYAEWMNKARSTKVLILDY